MRILVDENIPQGPEAFSAYGSVRIFAGRSLRRGDLGGADALLVRSVTPVNEALLRGTPVRFVGTATIGTDHVDADYLRKTGIGFASAPGCNARSVAEYIIAALLHLRVRRGLVLEGKTLGIIGFGHVGKQVARLAPHLGLKILRCDPPLADAGHAGPFLTPPKLIEKSDILTVHVPLSESGPFATRGMLNPAFFASFNNPKTLLNTSRGEVMDEQALLQAMDQGKLSHLVLDVFCGEPSIHPELAGRADLISPHVAGYSLQGKLNGISQVLEAFCRHFGLEKKSGIVYPTPSHPIFPFPRKKMDPDSVLRFCVAHSHDSARDDRELRQVLGAPDLAKRFDALRRHYPERHEFAGFRITGMPPREIALRNRLLGLGFSVE